MVMVVAAAAMINGERIPFRIFCRGGGGGSDEARASSMAITESITHSLTGKLPLLFSAGALLLLCTFAPHQSEPSDTELNQN